LKKKGFVKGYHAKFSKEILTVVRIEKPYYYLSQGTRGYLRSEFIKVGESQTNREIPDLEGTREGNLKEIALRPIDEESIQRKEEIENSIPAPRPKRDRKKPERLTY